MPLCSIACPFHYGATSIYPSSFCPYESTHVITQTQLSTCFVQLFMKTRVGTHIDVAFEPSMKRCLPNTLLLLLCGLLISGLYVLNRISLIPNLFCLKAKTSTQFRNIVPNSIVAIIPQNSGHCSKQTGCHFVFTGAKRMNNSLGISSLLNPRHKHVLQTS
jgi:hypothetical protein